MTDHDDELERQVDEELERHDRMLELDARATAGEKLTPAEWTELLHGHELGEPITGGEHLARIASYVNGLELDELEYRRRGEERRRRREERARRRDTIGDLALLGLIAAVFTALVILVYCLAAGIRI